MQHISMHHHTQVERAKQKVIDLAKDRCKNHAGPINLHVVNLQTFS